MSDTFRFLTLEIIPVPQVCGEGKRSLFVKSQVELPSRLDTGKLLLLASCTRLQGGCTLFREAGPRGKSYPETQMEGLGSQNCTVQDSCPVWLFTFVKMK